MQDIFVCMKTRRSVRRYKPDAVPQELLAPIVEAGLYAASGLGRQSPIILQVTDRAMRDRLMQLNAAVLGREGSDPFYGAPVVCVVLTDPEVSTCVEDGALVIGNLMLAAHSLGVASCWIHRAREEFDSPEGKALLKKWGVDERYIGVGHCILGYPAGDPQTAAPRKSDYILKV